eukprot:TRINITY_DN21947_c0_g1_i1.p1 TRINITY_DN21947_c0_g1~~TRINITY_DN21947_c0_g1_i1.p1  ORF type:complete len:514 (-),score=155.66 TRINITY_DN21947_c0_g1_i1:48-1589(-)
MAAAGGEKGGADLDLQAVENIPKDTLVALLRRKDKDAKALAAKLEKLEERYVKVVRFNKILMEDRTSFLRFCSELLPESGGIFEEAAAQEIPVNLEALLRKADAWRNALEASQTEHRVFQQFTEFVFPGDEAVRQLFERPSLGVEALDTLQQRWMALEDLHNQSIASINSMSRDQILARSKEHEAAIAGKEAADQQIQELRDQLTAMAREKAQLLKQRLSPADGSPAGEGLAPSYAPATSSSNVAAAGEVQELRAERDAAERRALQAAEAAAARERDLRRDLEAKQAEVQRVRSEMERLQEEADRQRAQARRQLEDKDQAHDRLQQKLREMEQEVGGNAFIGRLAEQQAGRDAELRAHQRQVGQLNETVAEIQRLLAMSYSQERVLKDRIRELEGSHGRVHVASDYLKHCVLKYIQYNQRGDIKAQTLVPVLSTLLNLTCEEKSTIEESAIPQSLLLLNQAVGDAASWFRGSAPPAEKGGSRKSAAATVPPDDLLATAGSAPTPTDGGQPPSS